MKKIRCLLLIAACLMGWLILSSCSAVFTPPAQEAEPVYEIFYTSNGDGTCYVHKITVNAEQNEPFVLEVPQKSPAGDTVTAIKCEPFANLIPQILTEEEYNRLIALVKQKYEAGEITRDERYLLSGIYVPTDLELHLCGELPEDASLRIRVYKYMNHTIDGDLLFEEPDIYITNFMERIGYTRQSIAESYDRVRELINASQSPNRDAMLAAMPQIPDNFGIYISEIKLPDTVAEISDGFYSTCRLITSVTLPSSLDRIPEKMFYGMPALESVYISEGTSFIEFSAFRECESLKHVEIPNSMEEIAEDAFSYGLPLLKGTSYNYGYYLGNPENPYLALFKVSEKAVVMTTHPNTKIIGNRVFYDAQSLCKVTLSEGVVKTGWGIFANCSKLSDIALSNSLEVIGGAAFSGCSALKRIEIPENVTSIGRYAFSGCTSLTEIALPQGIEIIYEYTFNNTPALTAIAIPNSVKEIHRFAFNSCTALTSVVIPQSVSVLGEGVFADSGLKDLYYKGTAADWAKVKLEETSVPDSVTIYFYSEAQPTEPGNYWRYVDGVPVAW